MYLINAVNFNNNFLSFYNNFTTICNNSKNFKIKILPKNNKLNTNLINTSQITLILTFKYKNPNFFIKFINKYIEKSLKLLGTFIKDNLNIKYN